MTSCRSFKSLLPYQRPLVLSAEQRIMAPSAFKEGHFVICGPDDEPIARIGVLATRHSLSPKINASLNQLTNYYAVLHNAAVHNVVV